MNVYECAFKMMSKTNDGWQNRVIHSPMNNMFKNRKAELSLMGNLLAFSFSVHGNWSLSLDPKIFKIFIVPSLHLLLVNIRFTWFQLEKTHGHDQVHIWNSANVDYWIMKQKNKGLWVSAAEVFLWIECRTDCRSCPNQYLSQFSVNRHAYRILPLWVGRGLNYCWSIQKLPGIMTPGKVLCWNVWRRQV